MIILHLIHFFFSIVIFPYVCTLKISQINSRYRRDLKIAGGLDRVKVKGC